MGSAPGFVRAVIYIPPDYAAGATAKSPKSFIEDNTDNFMSNELHAQEVMDVNGPRCQCFLERMRAHR